MSDRASKLQLADSDDLTINPATSDNQTNWSQKTGIVINGADVGVQNPFSVDGDTIYEKDIDVSGSATGTFTGNIVDLFNSFGADILIDNSATNPKTFTITFNRPVTTNEIGFASTSGDFSNVKIQLQDTSDTTRVTIDDSANDTKFTGNIYQFVKTTFIKAVIEFHTVDTVSLSSSFIPKIQSRAISAIDGYISETNSSTSILTAGSIFTGTLVDTLNYGMVVVSLRSDQASATNGLDVQFSTDGTNWDHSDVFNIAADTGKTFTFQTVARFMRIIYTNGGVNQTFFRLQTILKPVYVKPSSHRVTDSITGEDDAELVKSVITGQDAAGIFRNVKLTNEGLLKTSVDSPVSAFWDLRVAELSPQFQWSFEYTVDNTDININTVVNGGTVTQSNGMACIGASTTIASTAMFQSKKPAKYRPWLWGLQRFTSLFTTGVADTEQYAGLMDKRWSSAAFANWYAIWMNGETFSVLRWRNDILVESISQSNFDDPLDGTGTSAITMDITKLNVFEIQYQYLGAGAINFFIEDPKTGFFIRFHTIKYANANTQPSTHNPNFHFTMFTNNKATTSDLIIKSASYAYFVEGKTKFTELHQPQNSSWIQTKNTVTTETAIFTIRNKTLYVSKTNFIDIFLENVTTSIQASSANNLGNLRLIKNATLWWTPSFTDINTSNSVVEIDTAWTTVTWGKEILSSTLAGKNDKLSWNLTTFDIIINPWESVTLAWQSANSATINWGLLWKELM